jgi:hypothetical protein
MIIPRQFGDGFHCKACGDWFRVEGRGCHSPETPFIVDSDHRVFRIGTVDNV